MSQYGTLLLDPPWAFRNYSGDDAIAQRAAEQHYPTMKFHEIAGLPVPDLAAKNCALFMWVTSAHIEHAQTLFHVWGFEQKSVAFIWIKSKLGVAEQSSFFLDDWYDDNHPIAMGHWTRQQTELCLLATKGKPPRKDAGVRQLIIAPRREHSRKPDEQYGRIERLVEGPFLEMFARQRWPGWDQHGNQADLFKAEAA